MQTQNIRSAPSCRVLVPIILFLAFGIEIQRPAAAQESAAGIEQSRSLEIQRRFPNATIRSVGIASADIPRVVEVASSGERTILARIPPSPDDKIEYADPRKILVSLKQGQSRRHLDSWLFKNKNSFRLVRAVGKRGLFLIELTAPGLANPWETVGVLKRSAFFNSAEVNQVVFLSGNQHGIRIARNQWSLEHPDIAVADTDRNVDIDGLEVLSRLGALRTGSMKEVIVAVMDSGIDFSHPALRNSLWVNPREIKGNHKDDDKNGRVDDINGWNFVTETNFIMDEQSHGTHVSGIIAAKPTAQEKMTGIAPNAKIMVLKTFGTQLWSMLDMNLAAIQYATDNGARVINMSWTTDVYSTILDNALRYANAHGVYLVAAAGNAPPGGKPADISEPGKSTYPCRMPFVQCVVATDKSGSVASFSNYNSQPWLFSVFAAPGAEILSTVPNGYDLKDGTSMASPHVAAAVAVIIGLNPKADSEYISYQLYEYADQVPSKSRYYNLARLNLYRSIFSPPALSTLGADSYCERVVENGVRSRNYPFANSREPGIDGKTESSAFTICSAQQLLGIDSLKETAGIFFVVKKNLDWFHLLESSRHRIGTSDRPFQGTFFGQGFTLKNFRFDSSPLSDSGLFSKIGARGAVVNFRMSNVQLTGESNVGALAGINEGLVNDVQVEGNVDGISNIGGVVGVSRTTFGAPMTSGLLRNVFFEGRVAGKNAVGGITGTMGDGAKMDAGFAKGSITANEPGTSSAGGAVGVVSGSAQVSRSHALAHVLAGGRAGGLVGTLRCGGSVLNSYSEGNVSAPIAGGLIGVIENASVRFTYSLSNAEGTVNAGGLIGKNEDDKKNDSTGTYACTGNATSSPRSLIQRSYFLSGSNLPGAGGVEKSELELQQRSTFDGWQFNSNWMLAPGHSPSVFTLPRTTGSMY